MKQIKYFILTLILLFTFSTAVQAQNDLDSLINKIFEQGGNLGKILVNFTMLSDQDEMSFGDKLAEDFNKDVVLSDRGISRIEKIGNKLIANVDRKAIQYKFRVIETDEINAFAIAGGNVYVTTALLDFIENDDELAFVIGHEIGHVDRKHSALMIQTLALAYTLGGDDAEMMASMAYKILSTPFTKYQEFDADQAGAYFSYSAGYDPNQAIKFFNKLSAKMEEEQQRQSSNNIDYIMRSHPWSKERAERIKNYIETNLK